MKVLWGAVAAVLIAAVAGATPANIAQFGTCMLADDVDPFTDEHENTMIVCREVPGAGVVVQCADRGRVVMLDVRSILTNEAARLRVGTGAVHDTIWQNPTGSPFYAVDTIDDVEVMAFINELLDGIAAGEPIVFQVGDGEVHQVTFGEGDGHAAAVAEFIARCDALDEASAGG